MRTYLGCRGGLRFRGGGGGGLAVARAPSPRLQRWPRRRPRCRWAGDDLFGGGSSGRAHVALVAAYTAAATGRDHLGFAGFLGADTLAMGDRVWRDVWLGAASFKAIKGVGAVLLVLGRAVVYFAMQVVEVREWFLPAVSWCLLVFSGEVVE